MYNFAAIPTILTSRLRWLNWQTVHRPGAVKPTKVPLIPATGQLADVMDPTTWGSFDQARANVEAGRVEGLGFVLGDGIAGIDLDDPKDDPERLKLYGEIMQRFVTYQEISPSGKGLHVIFAHNDGAEGGKRRGGVEFYYSKRFLTFTGNVWNGMTEIADCTAYGSILFEEMGGGDAAIDSGVDEAQKDDDQIVINRAASAANGNDFRALWAGQWLHHPSQSEADQHLMNIISFYTDNRDQAVRIFRNSALGSTLSRKGNPTDYLRRTVSKAFDQKLDASHYEQTARDLAELLKLDPRNQPVASLDEAPGLVKLNRLDPPPPLPGLLAEIADFIYRSSPHPVADVSMLAAIGLMAGICGRAYNVDGSGLNLYMLLVAPSGTGKDSMASGISALLASIKGEAGTTIGDLDMMPSADTFVGKNFVSAAAIHKYLPEHPSFVTIIPEYGKFLERIASPKAGPQDVQLVSTLLDLYSRSGGSNTHRAHVYSDRDNTTKDVRAPAVSILGETTGETFYKVLTETMINDGFLPRFLVWEYRGPRPYEQLDRIARPSPQLVTKLRTLVMLALEANGPKGTVRDVLFDTEARQLHTEFSTFATDQINSAQIDAFRNLWNRAALKLKRLAALGAISINPYNPIITRDIFLWAKVIIMRDVQSMLHKFEAGETGDQKEQSRNDYVLKLMRDFVTDRHVHQRARIKRAYYDAHIVPQSFLSTKTGGHGSFKNVVGCRSTHHALLLTIEVLIARGLVHEVPSVMMPEAIGSKARAFMLDPLAIT